MGTSGNKSEFEGLSQYYSDIEFIDNSNLESAFNMLIDSIQSENEAIPISKYVICGQEINYDLFFDDYESDPEYSRNTGGNSPRYKYTHTDPNYFENTLVIMEDSGEYSDNPKMTFDKVGKFIIELKVETIKRNRIV